MPRQTASYLVKQMRSAWRDALDGRASAFQVQVVFLALLPEDEWLPDWSVIFGLCRQ
jgi:hypothetical protein